MNRNHVFFSNVWKFQDFEYFYRFHVANRNKQKMSLHVLNWNIGQNSQGHSNRRLDGTLLGTCRLSVCWKNMCPFPAGKLSSAVRESTEKINLIFAHMFTRVSLQLLWFIGISFFLHLFVMNKSNLRRSFLSTSWHWAAFLFKTNKLSNNTWRLDVALCRAVI